MNLPSVTTQTQWHCELFKFGKANRAGTAWFNPSLVQRDDGLWLVTRRARDWPGMKYGMNDIVAFHLEGHYSPTHGIKVHIPPMLNGEHFEDPRAIYRNGVTWLSCCNFVVYPGDKWTGAHQLLCQVNNDWSTFKRFDPVYAFNGGSTSLNTGNEKNWLWFFHDGLPHLIYFTDPHTVVPFNEKLAAGTPYVTHEINAHWEHGSPRGGTPPVLYHGEYWSFFHSSTPWIGEKRRYHMGVYTFEAKPPFRITHMSSRPLLSGSENDPWAEGKPLVVFPGGAIIKDGVWTVVFGVNDLVCAWIDIPHKDLISITPTVKPIETEHEPEVVEAAKTDNRDSAPTEPEVEAVRMAVGPEAGIRGRQAHVAGDLPVYAGRAEERESGQPCPAARDTE